MTVPTQPNSNPGANGGGDGGGNPGGGDPNPNPAPNPAPNNNGGGQSIDLKSLDAEQLQQVLENPNLFNLPRIKELRDQAAELKTLKDQQARADEQALQEQKKFEELANKRGDDLAKATQTIETMRIDQALTNKLVPEGIVDLEAALKLADRSAVKVDDNGVVTGVEDVITSLKKDKAYLFNKSENDPSLGSPSNNNGGDGGGAPTKFKRSQLRDPKFYQEHRDEIIKAQAAGLIEDDVTPK